jgi:hypothetical protein
VRLKPSFRFFASAIALSAPMRLLDYLFRLTLENVSPVEQARRDSLHAKFCASLLGSTTALSFAFRGRSKDRVVFREFTSGEAVSAYCSPGGGKTLGHRQFHVALPELDCVFYESWDDTNHFFFTKPTLVRTVSELASKSGLYVLAHD